MLEVDAQQRHDDLMEFIEALGDAKDSAGVPFCASLDDVAGLSLVVTPDGARYALKNRTEIESTLSPEELADLYSDENLKRLEGLAKQ